MRSGELDTGPLRRHAAAFQGLLWLARLTMGEGDLTSDEAQCFFTVSRNAADPFLADQAAAIHREMVTGRALDLALLETAGEPGEFLDALSFCTQNRLIGEVHALEPEVIRSVAGRDEAFFWEDRAETEGDATCTSLILHYHFHRLGIPRERTLADLLRVAAPVALRHAAEASDDDLELGIYFASHWAYALSDYGARPLVPEAHEVLHAYLWQVLPGALTSGNVETLGEVVECLRIFGHSGDERLEPAVRYLLRRQNPDGSWGSARHDTQRHATWCAVNALYDYRPHAPEAWGPHWEHSVLEPLLQGGAA